MTNQRLHPNLAQIDILTRTELEDSLHKNLDADIRERLRGIEIQRFPVVVVTATAATQAIYTQNDQTPCGPEQGDVWLLRRVNVKAFLLTDTAKYILFRGSTPSDTANAYTGRSLLEGFAAAAAGQACGIGYYPSNRSVWLQPGEQIYAQVIGATIGNQYILEGEAIRVPAEMKGKIIS